jgi:hypothetical protein
MALILLVGGRPALAALTACQAGIAPARLAQPGQQRQEALARNRVGTITLADGLRVGTALAEARQEHAQASAGVKALDRVTVVLRGR